MTKPQHLELVHSDFDSAKRHWVNLKTGGGDGTSGDMEARVSKLEGQFEKLNDKVDEIRIDVAVLKEKVSNLPSKGFIVTATVGALALFSALVLFQERIATILAG